VLSIVSLKVSYPKPCAAALRVASVCSFTSDLLNIQSLARGGPSSTRLISFSITIMTATNRIICRIHSDATKEHGTPQIEISWTVCKQKCREDLYRTSPYTIP
jgi:hypothetical protein